MGKLQKIIVKTGREYLNKNLSPIINVEYEDIKWLIEQAERADIYKKVLMEIGAKHKPLASKIANDALWIADYRRNE